MRRSSAAALKTSASVFAALGDETRLRLAGQAHQRRTAIDLAPDVGHPAHAAGGDQASARARGAGVVRANRVGRESRFALDPKPIMDAQTYLEHVSRQWDNALARLKALVEED